MLSRDCRRQVDLIKKIKELEVPAAFCYIAPWSGEVFMAGDSRTTDSFRSKVEDILKKLNSNDHKLEPNHHVGLCLPKLPGRLEMLNGQSLQTIIVAIAKDLKISWMVKNQTSGQRRYHSATHTQYLKASKVCSSYMYAVQSY